MKIINIKITEFAGLCDLKLDFSEGLNIIEGLNESGKSTVNAFIKFMLYGLGKTKPQDSSIPEREYYTSWRNGIAEGSMTVEHNARQYRIERKAILSATYKDSFSVYDLITGEKVFKGREPGEIFLGISAEVYESTCCVRQREISDVDGKGVSGAIQNMLVSADKNTNLDRALKKLTDIRKSLKLQRGDGGRIPELERETANLTARIERAEKGNVELRRQMDIAAAKRKLTESLRAELNAAEDALKAFDAYKTLEAFDELHAIEEKIDELRDELDALMRSFPSEENIPSRTVADTLLTFERRIPSIETECERARALLDQYKSTPIPSASECRAADKIDSLGGSDKIIFTFSKFKKGAKLLSTLAAVFISVGGLSLLAGSILGVWLSPLLFLICAPALIFFGLSVFLFIKRKNKLKNIRALLRECEYPGTALPELFLLENHLNDCIKAKREIEKRREQISGAENAYSEKVRELERLLSLAAENLSPYCTPPISDIGNTSKFMDLLNETITTILAFCEKQGALKSSISVEERILASTRSRVEGQDEMFLRGCVTNEMKDRFKTETKENLERSRGYLAEQIRGSDAARETAEKKLIELESSIEDVHKLSLELEEKQTELERLKISLGAIFMASETIEKASVNLRSSVTPRLCEGASQRMARLTSGKYDALSLDGNINLSVTTDMTREIASLSSGTRDAAYLSLRFAMIDILFGDKKPCVTIDEGLSQLDDRRAASMLSVLDSYCGDGGQCILFTCHSREASLLENMGSEYKKLAI